MGLKLFRVLSRNACLFCVAEIIDFTGFSLVVVCAYKCGHSTFNAPTTFDIETTFGTFDIFVI